MEKLKKKRPQLEKSVHDPEQFQEMYHYTFGYAKNKEQKCMDVDVCTLILAKAYDSFLKQVAIALWTLILADRYALVSEFTAFLQVWSDEASYSSINIIG